jgi:hyperosmotically inducible protein
MEKRMKKIKIHHVFALLFILSTLAPVVKAQTPPATWSLEDSTRIIKDVQRKILGLSDYGVFDDIRFSIKAKSIVVMGYASRPSLKNNVGNALKGIAGIESVDNQIEVLPVGPNDDRIRADVYTKIYTTPSLRKYNGNAGGVGRNGSSGLGESGRNSIARAAGGITVDPPIGFHAIKIIVKNGNVILRGAVLNEGDADIATIQTNSIPGIFSVTNELGIESAPQKKK